MSRLFKYGDQAWEDPGPEFSNDDVKKQLTAYFPELANADVKEAALPDGRTEVSFVKRAGTKGSGDVTPDGISPSWIAARLANVKPANLEGPTLLGRLQELERAGRLEASALVEMQPVLERSMAELDAHVVESKKVLSRCSQLTATPSLSTPAGF